MLLVVIGGQKSNLSYEFKLENNNLLLMICYKNVLKILWM